MTLETADVVVLLIGTAGLLAAAIAVSRALGQRETGAIRREMVSHHDLDDVAAGQRRVEEAAAAARAAADAANAELRRLNKVAEDMHRRGIKRGPPGKRGE